MPPRSAIAINASVLGPAPSGLGQYARGLIRSLDPLRDGLVVHTSWPEALPGLRATVRRAASLIRPDRGIAGHAARLVWCQTALRARLVVERPAVLLNTLPEGVFRCDVPQVTVVHDLIPLVYPRDYPRQQFYFRRLVPAILRQSHTVIAVSEATRHEVISAYGLRPERVRAIPNGYDTEEFVPLGPATDDGGVPYVLYVGNVLPHKNLPRLIDAVARAARRTPVRLVMAGSGATTRVAELRRLADNAGTRLDLMPYMSSRALSALYRGARLVALPSLVEGFGLPALEAIACGTPVVVGNNAAMQEVVGAAGVLVNPDDTDAMADAILRLLTEESLRKDLVAAGLARAATFSWERTARQVLTVLDEVARA